MTGRNPLVSVVIPAYNSCACIGRALRSVLAQDYAAREIIVVDDGSEDRTAEAVRAFGSAVRLVRREHAGAAAARNAGIAASTGEHIAFLDADDEWLAGRLSSGVDPMIDDHGAGMTYCLSIGQRPDGTRVRLNEEYERHRAFPRILWPSPFQFTPATTCRRAVLEQAGGFDESLAAWEDQDLWIRMAEHADVREVPERLVVIHLRSGSLSDTTALETKRAAHFRVIERALERQPDIYRPHEKMLFADHHLVWGINYYSAGDHRRARRSIAASLRHSPTLRGIVFFLKALLPPGMAAVLSRIKHGR